MLFRSSSIEIENSKVASLAKGGLLSAMADGNTKLKVKVGNKEATADVVVQNYSKADPISFHRDVIAATEHPCKDNTNKTAKTLFISASLILVF